jgi:DNA-binding CsgD family transcriptional regulator
MTTGRRSPRSGANPGRRARTAGKPQVDDAPSRLTLSSAEAIAVGNPRLALMGQALVWLMRFGDVAVGLFHPVDRRLRRSREVTVTHLQTSALDDATPILAAREERDELLDPFAPRQLAPAGLGVVDLAHLGRSEAARYVDGFLAPLGLRSQTTLLLRAGGHVVAAVDLLGTSRDPALVAGWLGFLRSSHAFLEQAYACALALPTGYTAEAGPQLAALTSRELTVARLVAGGARNSEVAGALAIAEATVKTHLVRIYEKLGIGTRTQLAVVLRGASSGLDDDGGEPGDELPGAA